MSTPPEGLRKAVIRAWLTRSNPHVTVRGGPWPLGSDRLEPNALFHPGKASRIYKRFRRIIDEFIDSHHA